MTLTYVNADGTPGGTITVPDPVRESCDRCGPHVAAAARVTDRDTGRTLVTLCGHDAQTIVPDRYLVTLI